MERPWEFPVLRQPVRIATSGGERRVDGATLGGLAVTPSSYEVMETGRACFVITHAASGMLVSWPFGFDAEAQAIGAMRALVALPVDWRADRPGMPSGLGAAVRAILAAWDAFYIEDVMDGPGGHAG